MDKPHILIVEDDPDVSEPLSRYLEMNGFAADVTRGEEDALALARANTPDLVLLDITLDSGDGISLCRRLNKKSSIPVIFVTGHSEDMERVIGLELGADDYVIKPFSPRELVARIRAVLRRANGLAGFGDKTARPPRLTFGSCVLDTSSQLLTNGTGDTYTLSPGELRLLQVFLDNPHTIMDRGSLLDATKGEKVEVFDRSIDSFIARLRKKIEENPSFPKIIKTYWGGGYALSCDVRILH